ncbi:MAG: hypothetical protein ACR2O8_12800 [Rhizobiaceae bacterium]
MKRVALVLMSIFVVCGSAMAQMVADVKFERGNYGATVNGTIKGDEYFDYRLDAKAGQQMSVKLDVSGTNGHGTAYFNILPPGSDGVAIYNASVNGNTTTTDLPENGTYTIRVYLMGNDRDTGKTVGYSVVLSIK